MKYFNTSVIINFLCFLTLTFPAIAISEETSLVSQNIPIPFPMTVILRNATVQHELELDAKQINEIDTLLDKVELPLFQLRDIPQEQRNLKAANLINNLKNNLKIILNKKQIDRLYNLTWQLMGITAFEDTELVNKLKLGESQKKRIHNVIKQLNSKIAKSNQENQNSEEADLANIKKTLYLNANQRINKILTAEQNDNLPKILGESFDFSSFKYLACKAPEFQPVETWLNTDTQQLPSLKGKVTVIHFYAFSCINCIHNIPFYNKWQSSFPPDNFQIIGIHRPETKNEEVLDNVKKKAQESKMIYPIAVDLDSKNWDTWANNIWPSIYLVDKDGYIRYWWYGELNWQGAQTEKILRQWIDNLLKEK